MLLQQGQSHFFSRIPSYLLRAPEYSFVLWHFQVVHVWKMESEKTTFAFLKFTLRSALLSELDTFSLWRPKHVNQNQTQVRTGSDLTQMFVQPQIMAGCFFKFLSTAQKTKGTWGGTRRFYKCFRSWSNWLNRTCLLSCQLLKTYLPLLKHFFHTFLLLENLLHMLLWLPWK